MNDEFNFKNTSFWGAVAGAFWFGRVLIKYMADRNAKQTNERKKAYMSDKKDIKDVLDIVEFGFAARNVIGDLFDGGFNILKLGELLPLYPKAMAAYDGAGNAPAELADMDESEAAELVALIVSKGVASEHAAAVIGKSLKVGVSVIELLKEIKA